MSMHKNHPFHLVDYSPWPLLGSLNVMTLMMGLIKWFHLYNINLFMISTISMLLIMYLWCRDVTRESTYLGLHTLKVNIGLRFGMILFIISKIFFLLDFFGDFSMKH